MKWKTLGFSVIFLSLSFLSYAHAESIKELFTQGEQLYSQGEFKKAIDFYEKTIELDPNFAPAYNSLGLVHREINTDLSEIAWLFKTATEIDPKFAQAYDNLGKAYYGMGEFDKAEQSCLKALDLAPGLLSSQLSLGWIYLLGKSQPKEAIYYFNEVIKKNKIPYAYLGLGMGYFMSGNRPMVLDVITTLREMQKEDMAKQLENMVRSSYYREQANGTPLVNTQPAEQAEMPTSTGPSSQLVSSGPVQPMPSADDRNLGTSTMRVRLKGKMHMAPNPVNASAGLAAQSSIVPSGSPETLSGIEKIRQLRANALGMSHPSDSSAIQKIRQIQNIQRNGGSGSATTNISY